MSDKSKIEWTDATWNPIRGCSRVSEGCRNCYAERTAARFSGPGQPYEGLAVMGFPKPHTPASGQRRPYVPGHWTGEVRFIPELLDQPLCWKRPRKIFVNSMSDLFHEKVQDQWITDIFGIMALSPWHTYQILTKRPQQMLDYLAKGDHGIIEQYKQMQRNGGIAPKWFFKAMHRNGRDERFWQWPLPNVWLGVSVEDQKTADERIPLLLQTPAAVRWVSYEPALGPIDFQKIMYPDGPKCALGSNVGQIWCKGLDWIVCGGESGPGARPAHPDWFRIVRDQCAAAGVHFFFKQWGEWLHASQMNHAFTNPELDRISFKTICRDTGNGDLFIRVGKKRAGHLLDGKAWQEFPK